MALLALGAITKPLEGAFEWLQQASPSILRTAPVTGAVAAITWVAVVGVRLRGRRRSSRFLDLARHVATLATPSDDDVAAVASLRPKLMPEESMRELEALYREAVSQVTSDFAVTKDERRRLDRLARAFQLSSETSHRANVDGFLQAHAALVGDARLTPAGQHQLAELQKALRVPDTAIQAQLAHSDELVRARVVLSTSPPVIDPGVKLKAEEACYYATPFVEKKERVARSYVQDGARHKEMTLETVRDGRLFVTNERVLLVCGGSTTLKYEKILESAVDPESRLLALTVDGRKTPYLFDVSEPFVAAAYIQRASGGA
jgi:hypothetical protein